MFKESKNAHGFMNLFLLHIIHRNITATHVTIFVVMRTRIQIQS